MSNSYAIVSALIFALVAVGHIVRLINRWTVQIGPYNVSMNVSWAALRQTKAAGSGAAGMKK
jgi:hypothetical protein